jgi:Kelch motif
MDTTKLSTRSTILAAGALIAAACGPATVTPSPIPTTPVPGTPAPSAPQSPTAAPPSASPAHVEKVGSMVRPRVGFDSVVLGDGTVLAVGDDSACLPGPAEPGSETAERFDPATNAWAAAQSLNKPRKTGAMVRLDDGRALVIGGINADDQNFSSTKLFVPASAAWTDGPLLGVARNDPAAATSTDGRVVVASATIPGETGDTTTTEILDAKATAWKNGKALKGVTVLTLVPLADGRMLSRGFGFEMDDFEVFDPSTGSWKPIDGPTKVRQPAFAPLPDGGVIAFGTEESAVGEGPSTRVERFDPATAKWSEAAPMSVSREGALVTTLADGRVFVAGGSTATPGKEDAHTLASTEIYDPAADGWSAGPDLLEARKEGAALTLDDGSILIHGGNDDYNTEGDVPWCPEPMTTAERVYLGS